MRYRSRWGRSIVCALALHLVCLVLLIALLPAAEPAEDDAFLRVEVGDEEIDGDNAAAVVEEVLPEDGEDEIPTEEAFEAPPEPQPKDKREDEEKDPPKPTNPQKPRRNRDDIKPIGRPAIIDPKTQVSLKETETDYRGKATFYVTVTAEGRVAEVKEMRLDPPVEGKIARRDLEAKIAALVILTWRYTPSASADGTPQEQTKREEMTIPMKNKEAGKE